MYENESDLESIDEIKMQTRNSDPLIEEEENRDYFTDLLNDDSISPFRDIGKEDYALPKQKSKRDLHYRDYRSRSL